MSFLFNISVTLVLSVCYELLSLIRTYCVQGASKIFGQTSGVTSPHQNMEKVSINVRPQTVCEVQAETCLF